jgi:hypothetical protein
MVVVLAAGPLEVEAAMLTLAAVAAAAARQITTVAMVVVALLLFPYQLIATQGFLSAQRFQLTELELFLNSIHQGATQHEHY